MSQQLEVARRWEPYFGVAYVVLFIASVAASNPPADNASTAKWIANYTGHAEQTRHLATGLLLALAGLALMAFLVALWRHISETDTSRSYSRLPLAAAGATAGMHGLRWHGHGLHLRRGDHRQLPPTQRRPPAHVQ